MGFLHRRLIYNSCIDVTPFSSAPSGPLTNESPATMRHASELESTALREWRGKFLSNARRFVFMHCEASLALAVLAFALLAHASGMTKIRRRNGQTDTCSPDTRQMKVANRPFSPRAQRHY